MIQLQVRKDTAANWSSSNPTLLAGEVGLETDTGLFKVGTGSTAWNSLTYMYPDPYKTTAEVITTLTAGTWTVPDRLRSVNGRWRVTLVGGGGGGGGPSTTAGNTAEGGGSGGVCIGYYSYVNGVNTMSYDLGAGGTGGNAGSNGNNGQSSTVTYNGVTITAGGGGLGGGGTSFGAGGVGGTATGGTLNIQGGQGGGGGLTASNSPVFGFGGNTPLGFGFGYRTPGTAGGQSGLAGQGYGAGGTGGKCGSSTTGRSGGDGAQGLLIIEY